MGVIAIAVTLAVLIWPVLAAWEDNDTVAIAIAEQLELARRERRLARWNRLRSLRR